MAEGDAKGLLGRIEGALSFANELVQAQARFFQINPSVVERLKAISGQDRRYLAHEYFNADWHPTPFSELASSLNQAKLSFGASANLLDHIEKLHVTEAGAQLLAKEKHVVLRETLRDYLVNQQFRRDIFIRGPRSLPLLERTKHLHDLAVVSLCDLSTIPMTIPGLVGEIKLSENIYRPIIETIQEIESSKRSMDESCTLAMIEEKIRQLTATPINFAQIVQATTVLVHQGKLGLAQRSEFVRSSQSHCDRLNTWIIRQSAASGDIGFLASPIVGGVAVSRIEQLVMLVRSKESDNLNTIATTIWKILEGQGQRLTKNGQALKDEAENIEEMKLQVATFLKDKYPILKRLGIYCRPSDQEYYY